MSILLPESGYELDDVIQDLDTDLCFVCKEDGWDEDRPYRGGEGGAEAPPHIHSNCERGPNLWRTNERASTPGATNHNLHPASERHERLSALKERGPRPIGMRASSAGPLPWQVKTPRGLGLRPDAATEQ